MHVCQQSCMLVCFAVFGLPHLLYLRAAGIMTSAWMMRGMPATCVIQSRLVSSLPMAWRIQPAHKEHDSTCMT